MEIKKLPKVRFMWGLRIVQVERKLRRCPFAYLEIKNSVSLI